MRIRVSAVILFIASACIREICGNPRKNKNASGDSLRHTQDTKLLVENKKADLTAASLLKRI